MAITRLLNIGLRLGTLGIRFLFVFFLAKYLDAASVGYYGIFTATIGYGLFFVGLEFYVFVTREILRVPGEHRGRFLKAHAALSGMLYLAWLPLAVIFLSRVGWPEHLAWWFMPILFFEHFNQEIFRLLIVMSAQITASLLLFVRQGSWAIVIVLLMPVCGSKLTLDIIMLTWLISGFAAAALGVRKLNRLEISGWQAPIDWAWVRRGLMVAAPFLVATLSLRGILTIDRYWLEALGGIEIVGSYVLFFGMVSALSVFLDAGVFSYTYPDLIKHNYNNEHSIARAKVRQMLFQTMKVSAGFALISCLLLPYVLTWIGNPVHEKAIRLYPWLLLAMTILAVSQVPHWALYARGRDRTILLSHIVTLVVFVVSTWAASGPFGPYAVLIGLNIAFTVLMIWKTTAYLLLTYHPLSHEHT